MKKWTIALVVAGGLATALIGVTGAIVYRTSNLSLDAGSASYTKSVAGKNMGKLTIKAPYGYYVITYSVVPNSLGDNPFALGGKGMGNNPMGLFDDDTVHATYYPTEGGVDDIPPEKHVLISSKLNTAATAELPKDQAILAHCGTYVIITKDRSIYDRLEEIVAGWTVDKDQE